MYHKHVLFQVQAEIDVINASWDSDGSSSNLADSLGLMVYEGTQALNYVKNYAAGADQWQGFPVQCRAPSNTILLGAKVTAVKIHMPKHHFSLVRVNPPAGPLPSWQSRQ